MKKIKPKKNIMSNGKLSFISGVTGPFGNAAKDIGSIILIGFDPVVILEMPN